jgi:hypothetical protein
MTLRRFLGVYYAEAPSTAADRDRLSSLFDEAARRAEG